MSKDRRESNRKYYEKHKARWKKYRRRAKIKAKKKLYGSYNYVALTEKQKKFKKAVEQGIEPVEAVRRAYPAEENPGSKLSKLKQNPILGATIAGYVAEMIDAGFTTKYQAKSQFDWCERALKEDSTPHDVRNAIIILQDFRKTQGWDVERRESRNYNININVGPEQAKFMEDVPEEEIIDVEESNLEKEE